MKEAQRVGTVNIAASTESENFARIPRQDELKLTANAAYVHMTTNNTLFGTEWTGQPSVGDVPLVADASSDIFSRPIDVAVAASVGVETVVPGEFVESANGLVTVRVGER